MSDCGAERAFIRNHDMFSVAIVTSYCISVSTMVTCTLV